MSWEFVEEYRGGTIHCDSIMRVSQPSGLPPKTERFRWKKGGMSRIGASLAEVRDLADEALGGPLPRVTTAKSMTPAAPVKKRPLKKHK